MIKKMYVARCLAVLTSALLLNTSCSLIPSSAPDDLSFISIKLLDVNALSNPDKYDVEHYMGDGAPDKVLRVVFSSKTDIQEANRDWNNARLWILACHDWRNLGKVEQDSSGGYVPIGPISMTISSVYQDNIDIFNIPYNQSIDSKKRQSEPLLYHFYVAISKKIQYPRPVEYNLHANPEDLCFQISAAELFGAKTNVVKIPKAAITSALQGKAQ